jgi:hypothetical protein
MVVDDAATILADRSHTGKRRVHFINLFQLTESFGKKVHDHLGRNSYAAVARLVIAHQLVESFSHVLTVLGDRQAMPARSNVLGRTTIGNKEARGTSRCLKSCKCRSRSCMGWCEFSARLLRYRCYQSSTPGNISRLTAP